MILVTGGTGLVGSHLLYSLTKKEGKVRAIYRTKKSIQKTKLVFESYNAEQQLTRIEWVKAELTDYFSLKDAFKGISYVYHAAAMVSFDPKLAKQVLKVNVEGTENMVNISLEHPIKKFCFVSSVSSLGEYQNGKCTDESAARQNNNSTTNYSLSKYYAENEVWRASQEGLPVIIVNPATILGFGDWESSSLKIIKRVYDGLPFYTPGKNGFVGVADVVKIMLQLMASDRVNERYILVSENLAFKDLFQKIAVTLNVKPPRKKAGYFFANLLKHLDQIRAKITGTTAVLTSESIRTAYKEKCYNATKIKSELGFEFEPLDQTIEKTGKLFLSYKSKLAKLS